jgi:hypothetical protein
MPEDKAQAEKLFSIAEASLRAPEGTVRQVVFPAGLTVQFANTCG